MSPGEATTSPREATTSPAGPRIYWLTTEFYPPETGGTGMIAARLAHGLGERGLGVQIITRQVLPPSARSESIGTIQVRRVDPPGRMKGAGWRAVPAMLSFIVRVAAILCLETRRYDIVMVSGMKTLPITAVPVSRLLGKRCVIRVESPFELVEPISAESLQMMHGMLGRCMSGLLRRMQQAVLRRATCVIAISQDIEERLAQSKHPPARIVRIPNAVDLSKFTPVTEEQKARLRDRLGYPAGRTIVLYVGRLSRAKGVMNLIEGWPELMRKFPSAHLVMVGSGKGSWDDCEADILEYLRVHRLESHITMAGHSDAVNEHLQAADLFVSPSDYEGFSLTLVEALGCGIPVVSTAVGAAPEFIRTGENGFLCEPRDRRSLSAALELALQQQEDWPGIRRRARETAEAFDVPRVVDQYVTLLRDLAPPS
ncbi:MAG TPA: glycosyltransferase family 4 protein [Steroidobacteraceae bacterium]|nr:glycosyltransferase family 4 protein [Steroidobacteraceae bacterium]